MPSPLTTVTELATGLGMLGFGSSDEALAARPRQMVSVSPGTWDHLLLLREQGAYDAAFDAAFANGRAFLHASDALRGRLPLIIEWKGSHRAPGDEVAPIDLRIDHVYLVSCKYLSKILCNASPSHLFDELLSGRHGRRSSDWYDAIAPAEHQALYDAARRELRRGPSDQGAPGPEPGTTDRHRQLPPSVAGLRNDDRRWLSRALAGGWPGTAADRYTELVEAVSAASARRWQDTLRQRDEREPMLWRLLRMGSAPYFVLGTTSRQPVRRRIATPWDWRQRFRLRSFDVAAQPGGQPRVGWKAEVTDVVGGRHLRVDGHVEVRWSHGRFGGAPEAKVYLDTDIDAVPGYVPLA